MRNTRVSIPGDSRTERSWETSRLVDAGEYHLGDDDRVTTILQG